MGMGFFLSAFATKGSNRVELAALSGNLLHVNHIDPNEKKKKDCWKIHKQIFLQV